MNIKRFSSVILTVSIFFLAMTLIGVLTSCGRETPPVADSPPVQAVTGASESPDPEGTLETLAALGFGEGTSGISRLQGTEKWRKIAPNEIRDNPVML